MKKFAADEHVPRHALARDAEHARDRHRLLHHRHVARLAALRVLEIAVQPLLIGHLLGQAADRRAARSQRVRDERVARRAQLRLPDVLGLRRPVSLRRAAHDARVPRLDFERTVLRPFVRIRRGGDDEAAVEALARAEPLLADLMAHRARHAVRRLTPFLLVSGEAAGARTPRPAVRAASRSVRVIGMWHTEHSSSIAAFDSG